MRIRNFKLDALKVYGIRKENTLSRYFKNFWKTHFHILCGPLVLQPWIRSYLIHGYHKLWMNTRSYTAYTLHMVARIRRNYRTWAHSNCPRCNAPKENTSRVLQCPETSTCIEWDNQLKGLKEWMKKKEISPNVTQIIIINMHTW